MNFLTTPFHSLFAEPIDENDPTRHQKKKNTTQSGDSSNGKEEEAEDGLVWGLSLSPAGQALVRKKKNAKFSSSPSPPHPIPSKTGKRADEQGEIKGGGSSSSRRTAPRRTASPSSSTTTSSSSLPPPPPPPTRLFSSFSELAAALSSSSVRHASPSWWGAVDAFTVEVPLPLSSPEEEEAASGRDEKSTSLEVEMTNYVFHLPSSSSSFVETSSPAARRWLSLSTASSSSSPLPPRPHSHTTGHASGGGEHAKEAKAAGPSSSPPHLVLAAHWDTKREPSRGMVGAMDSAVSVLLLRQWMQEVRWWKEMTQLVQWALEEEHEKETATRHPWWAKKRGGGRTAASESTPTTSSFASARFCCTEAHLRFILQTLLHPSHAAVLLEYAFPAVPSTTPEACVRLPFSPLPWNDDRPHTPTKEEGGEGAPPEGGDVWEEEEEGAIGPSSSSPVCHPFASHASSSCHLSSWLLAAYDLPDVSVLWFDGEEAWVEWKDEDHTYGSRHLAQLWRETRWRRRKQPHRNNAEEESNTAPPPSSSSTASSSSWMSSVTTFILLDLIGGEETPTFRNFFPGASGHLFESLHLLERARREGGGGGGGCPVVISPTKKKKKREKGNEGNASPPHKRRETSGESARRAGGTGDEGSHAGRGAHQCEKGEEERSVVASPPPPPPSWVDFGIPLLWYAPPPSAAQGTGTLYFSKEEAARPRPATMPTRLVLEDDYMHWLDAGETNDDEETEREDGDEKMRAVDPQAHSPRAHRKEEKRGSSSSSSVAAGRPNKNGVSPVKKPTRSHLSCAMLPLVPLPFPPQWHTQEDDLDHVSLDMVMNFYVLFTTFLFFSPS